MKKIFASILALSAIHDSRDDSMMPGSGHLYDLTVWRYDDLVGSDFDYTKSQLKLLWFTELAEELEVTPQFVNQQYLKCLQETPVLAHIMKNRSSKVERYKSQHVNDAQALGDIMKGLK